MSDKPHKERPQKKKTIRQSVAFYIREVVAWTFWIFLFIKGFVYDLDLIVVHRFAIIERFYPYKLFFLLGILSITWLALGTKRFLKTIGYVLVFPLVLLLWKIPKTLFANWTLLVIFFPAIESTLFTLKWRFSLASLAVLAAVGVVLVDDRVILIPLMMFLGGYLIVHYVLRLRVVFKPSTVFANIVNAVTEMWRNTVKQYKRKDFEAHTGAGPQGEAYEKKRIENIKELYLNNLMWEFLAKKLNETVATRRTDLYFIVAVLYSFVLTVILFGFQYCGLHKIDPDSFDKAQNAPVWSFILFSFNTIMHTNFSRLIPVSDAALALANFELVAGGVTLVFFVYIVMTSSRERYRQDFRSLAAGLAKSSNEIERFLEKSLKMRRIDAEAKILQHDPKFEETLRSFGRAPIRIDDIEVFPPHDDT